DLRVAVSKHTSTVFCVAQRVVESASYSSVMEEFGQLPFERVTDELQCPACREQRDGDGKGRRREPRDRGPRDRDHDHRDAQRVAEAIDRMLMAARILCDPLFRRASAHVAELMR